MVEPQSLLGVVRVASETLVHPEDAWATTRAFRSCLSWFLERSIVQLRGAAPWDLLVVQLGRVVEVFPHSGSVVVGALHAASADSPSLSPSMLDLEGDDEGSVLVARRCSWRRRRRGCGTCGRRALSSRSPATRTRMCA